MVKIENPQSINNILNESKKKRGRPRKTTQDTNIKEIKIEKQNVKLINESSSIKQTEKEIKKQDNSEEEIILHFPFKLDELELHNNANSDDKKKSSSTVMVTESHTEEQNTNVFTIAGLSDETYSDDSDNISSELKKKIKEKDDQIKILEDKNKEYRKIINDSIMTGMNNDKMSKMNIDFINLEDGKSIVVKSTDISCWWCTEQFDNTPCFIPDKYENNKYHVFGCFCSYECAAAHNINTDDYKVWDKYSLMNVLYKQIFGEDKELTIAPPRQCLEKFGGPLSLDEFRKNINNNKEYRFVMPPMVSIVPSIEQSIKNNKKWDKIKTNNPEDDLVLKRKKPLPGAKNTLFETMGIFKKAKN
jgi:hypothetical protein